MQKIDEGLTDRNCRLGPFLIKKNRGNPMEQKLQQLFDLQMFMENDTLAELIRDTESHYGTKKVTPISRVALSDEDLEELYAAGSPYEKERPKKTQEELLSRDEKNGSIR